MIKYILVALRWKNTKGRTYKMTADNIVPSVLEVRNSLDSIKSGIKKFEPFRIRHLEQFDYGFTEVPDSTTDEGEILKAYIEHGESIYFTELNNALSKPVYTAAWDENKSYGEVVTKNFKRLLKPYGSLKASPKYWSDRMYVIRNYHRIDLSTGEIAEDGIKVFAGTLNHKMLDALKSSERLDRKQNGDNADGDRIKLREYVIPDGKTFMDLSVKKRYRLYRLGKYTLQNDETYRKRREKEPKSHEPEKSRI